MQGHRASLPLSFGSDQTHGRSLEVRPSDQRHLWPRRPAGRPHKGGRDGCPSADPTSCGGKNLPNHRRGWSATRWVPQVETRCSQFVHCEGSPSLSTQAAHTRSRSVSSITLQPPGPSPLLHLMQPLHSGPHTPHCPPAQAVPDSEPRLSKMRHTCPALPGTIVLTAQLGVCLPLSRKCFKPSFPGTPRADRPWPAIEPGLRDALITPLVPTDSRHVTCVPWIKEHIWIICSWNKQDIIGASSNWGEKRCFGKAAHLSGVWLHKVCWGRSVPDHF